MIPCIREKLSFPKFLLFICILNPGKQFVLFGFRIMHILVEDLIATAIDHKKGGV